MRKQTMKWMAMVCGIFTLISVFGMSGCSETPKNSSEAGAEAGEYGDPELCTLCPDPETCCFCYQYGDCVCDEEHIDESGGESDGGETGNDAESGDNGKTGSKTSTSSRRPAVNNSNPGRAGSGQSSGGGKIDSDWKPSFTPGEKITIMREWGAYPNGQNTAWDNWNKRVAELEQKYNIDIIEKEWSATLMQESLAAVKPAGNLYQVGASDVWSLANAGYIADWNNAMKATGIDMTSEIYLSFNVELCNLNGKQYAVGVEEARINTGILFNKKLVDEFGDIYALMDSKEWKWSKLTEIARKVKAKYPDKYAIGMTTDGVSAMAISNGSSLVAINSSGKPVSNLSNDAVKEALDQIYNWCNTDKLVTANWGQIGWNALDNEFANGNIAFLFCQESSLGSAYSKMGENDYGFAYLPMGPKMKEYRASMIPAYPYVIPNAYKDRASDYLLLINELYKLQPGYTKDSQFRDLWIRSFKSSKAYNTYKNMNRDLKFGFNSPAAIGSDKNTWSSVAGKLFQGQITTGVLVETYNDEYNRALSDRWKNIKYTGSFH